MFIGKMGTVDHEPRLLGRWAQSITNHVYRADGHSRSRTMSIGKMGTVDHEPCLMGRWAQLTTNYVYWEDGHSRSRTTSTGKMGTVDQEPYLLGRWAQSITNQMYWAAGPSDGNGQLMREKFLELRSKPCYKNVHSGHGELFPNCEHEPLPNDRYWIVKR